MNSYGRRVLSFSIVQVHGKTLRPKLEVESNVHGVKCPGIFDKAFVTVEGEMVMKEYEAKRPIHFVFLYFEQGLEHIVNNPFTTNTCEALDCIMEGR